VKGVDVLLAVLLITWAEVLGASWNPTMPGSGSARDTKTMLAIKNLSSEYSQLHGTWLHFYINIYCRIYLHNLYSWNMSTWWPQVVSGKV